MGDWRWWSHCNFSFLDPTVLACRFRALNEPAEFSLEIVDRPPTAVLVVVPKFLTKQLYLEMKTRSKTHQSLYLSVLLEPLFPSANF